MSRLLSPDDKCIQVDVGRSRYSGTIIEASGSDAAMLKAAGYTEASIAGAPARSRDRVCSICGFHSFFAACGRCGGSCS